MTTGYVLDRPSRLTCPECGGAVMPERMGTLLQYRCHIGHVLTAETMLVATLRELETMLAACLRMLNERTELCREVAERGDADGRYRAALEAAAAQARERAETLRNMLQSEWVQPVELEHEGEPWFPEFIGRR